MTKAEILHASQEELQRRWIDVMNDRRTWEPEKSEQKKEWLMIGIRLALMRGDKLQATLLAIELEDNYGESLAKED